MGAYEVFKTAQVELCNTLSGELEKTKIKTFSIGPGLVKTETAMNGIEIVSNMMGMTTDEFYTMNENHILGVEEAGCGFALSVLLADKYNGLEIGSIQVLIDFGLLENQTNQDKNKQISFEKLKQYYKRQYKLLQGFEKDPARLKEHSNTLNQWIMDLTFISESI